MGLWSQKVEGYVLKMTCLGVKMTKSGDEMVHIDFSIDGT